MTTGMETSDEADKAEELRRSRKLRQKKLRQKKLRQRSSQEPTSAEDEPTSSTQDGESPSSKKIRAKDITGLKYFDKLAPLLELGDLGTQHVSRSTFAGPAAQQPAAPRGVDVQRRKCTLVTHRCLCPESCRCKETQRWLAWQEKRYLRPTKWPLST